MNVIDLKASRDLKKRLSLNIDLVDFKVFGSRLNENHDELSDLDVFIEVEFLNEQIEDKIYDIVWQVGFEYSLVISPLIFSKNEIENSSLRSSPIIKNIKSNGVTV